MLDERDESVNISFEMPRYEDHVNFIINHPYKAWYIIHTDNGDPIGNIYINQDNSLACFIKKEYQGKGYGTEAFKELVKMHPESHYLANVNPNNSIGISKLKDRFNGKLIQYTYKIKRDDILNLE